MARKPKIPEHVNHERWLVSYADFITLLFAFFTVLYATSQTDQGKVNKLVGAVERAFTAGIFAPGSEHLMFADGGGARGGDALDLGISLREVENQIRLSLEKGGPDSPIKIERHADGLTLVMQTRHFFAPGSPAMNPAALEELQRAARVLRMIRHRLRVEGHTASSNPALHAFSPDWALSVQRGLKVVEWLVAQGVSPSRLSVAGYAGYQPLQPNTTIEGRARNRRVEIVILEDKPAFWSKTKSAKPAEREPQWVPAIPREIPVLSAPAPEAAHVRH